MIPRGGVGGATLRSALIGAMGLAAVASLVSVVSAGAVVAEVHRALGALPLVLALEGGMLGCETFALWRLYGEERVALPLSEMIRAGLIGYPPMVLLPAGRTVAEGVRAGFLARLVGGPLAAAVAVEMQVLLLVAVSAISFLCAAGMYLSGGSRVAVLVIVGNGVLTGTIGVAMRAVVRRTRVGAWLTRTFPRLSKGEVFDEALRTRPPLPASAVAAVLVGRLFQVGELAVLFFAIAGHLEPSSALAVEGIHLVGASLGDLIPGQLGASDATFTVVGPALGLTASGALAIALLAHATQAVWCVIGAVLPFSLLARRPGVSLPAGPQ